MVCRYELNCAQFCGRRRPFEANLSGMVKMIDLVTAENQQFYREELEQMRCLCRKFHARERHWHGLDGSEADHSDIDAAIYLLAIENGHRVVGGSRLIPTSNPTLLSEVFPHLATVRSLPRSHRIYEWSGSFVVPERRESHVISPVASALSCAVQEYCLSRGIEQISIVTETCWLPRLLELGWNPVPLGLPEAVGDESIIAILCDVSEAVQAATRAVWGVSHPLLRSRDHYTSVGRQPVDAAMWTQ